MLSRRPDQEQETSKTKEGTNTNGDKNNLPTTQMGEKFNTTKTRTKKKLRIQANIYLAKKGQDGLTLLNTVSCTAGYDQGVLFVRPGVQGWVHRCVSPGQFVLKLPDRLKIGPKSRTIRLKKKVRTLFDAFRSDSLT